MKYLEFMYFNIISMFMGAGILMLFGANGILVIGILLSVWAIYYKDKEVEEENGTKTN